MEEFTAERLKEFNGADASKPIYLAVRGVVFDVSTNRAAYAPGGAYHKFAGKDASRALAKSSLEDADCIADVEGLSEEDLETLVGWETFYRKRYSVVGHVH
jgi:predicted heme/steroid binding protein